MTFSARKSLSCRYSALSLHSKTVGKWQISDAFSQSAFALPPLWVRSAFALPPLLRLEAWWTQDGMKKSSTLYKVRAERACSLCRTKQRHEVTLYKVRAERACSLCRAKQRHEVTLYKVRAERACSLCRAKQRHEVTITIRLSDNTSVDNASLYNYYTKWKKKV